MKIKELGNAVKSKRQSFFDNENFVSTTFCMSSFYKAFIHNSKGKMPRKIFIMPSHYKKILQQPIINNNFYLYADSLVSVHLVCILPTDDLDWPFVNEA